MYCNSACGIFSVWPPYLFLFLIVYNVYFPYLFLNNFNCSLALGFIMYDWINLLLTTTALMILYSNRPHYLLLLMIVYHVGFHICSYYI